MHTSDSFSDLPAPKIFETSPEKTLKEREEIVFKKMMTGALATAFLAHRRTSDSELKKEALPSVSQEEAVRAEKMAKSFLESEFFGALREHASAAIHEAAASHLEDRARKLKDAWNKKILANTYESDYGFQKERFYQDSDDAAIKKFIEKIRKSDLRSDIIDYVERNLSPKYVSFEKFPSGNYEEPGLGFDPPPSHADDVDLIAWLKHHPFHAKHAMKWMGQNSDFRYNSCERSVVSPEPFLDLPGMTESITQQVLLSQADELVDLAFAYKKQQDVHDPNAISFRQMYADFIKSSRQHTDAAVDLHMGVIQWAPGQAGFLLDRLFHPSEEGEEGSFIPFRSQTVLTSAPPFSSTLWTYIGSAKFQGMRDGAREAIYGSITDHPNFSDSPSQTRAEALRYADDPNIQEAYQVGKEDGHTAGAAWKKYVDDIVQDLADGAAETRRSLSETRVEYAGQHQIQVWKDQERIELERLARVEAQREQEERPQRERQAKIDALREDRKHLVLEANKTKREIAECIEEREKISQEKQPLEKDENEYEGLLLGYQLIDAINAELMTQQYDPEIEGLLRELKDKYPLVYERFRKIEEQLIKAKEEADAITAARKETYWLPSINPRARRAREQNVERRAALEKMMQEIITEQSNDRFPDLVRDARDRVSNIRILDSHLQRIAELQNKLERRLEVVQKDIAAVDDSGNKMGINIAVERFVE